MVLGVIRNLKMQPLNPQPISNNQALRFPECQLPGHETMPLCYLLKTPTSWSSPSAPPLKCAVCIDDQQIAQSDTVLVQRLLTAIESQIHDIEASDNSSKCQQILAEWHKTLKPLKALVIKLMDVIEEKMII